MLWRFRCRKPRRLVARAAVWRHEDGPSHQGVVCDLSARGLFMRPVDVPAEAMVPGARLRVVFFMNRAGEQQRMDVAGVIRWVGESRRQPTLGWGMEFESINGELVFPGEKDAYIDLE